MGFFKNIQEKTQQLKEKTQNSRQKLKISAKSKTRFAENASKKKPDLSTNFYASLSFYNKLLFTLIPTDGSP